MLRELASALGGRALGKTLAEHELVELGKGERSLHGVALECLLGLLSREMDRISFETP